MDVVDIVDIRMDDSCRADETANLSFVQIRHRMSRDFKVNFGNEHGKRT